MNQVNKLQQTQQLDVTTGVNSYNPHAPWPIVIKNEIIPEIIT